MSAHNRDSVDRAFALLQAGRISEAVPILRNYLKGHPNDSEVLHNLGMALSDLGKLDEARRYLHRVRLLQSGSLRQQERWRSANAASGPAMLGDSRSLTRSMTA